MHLHLDASAALQWVSDAALGETSLYLRERLLQKIASFRLPELPEFLAELVAEPFPRSRQSRDRPADEDAQFVYRAGAIAVAHSTPSMRSLRALVKAGLRIDDSPLLATV